MGIIMQITREEVELVQIQLTILLAQIKVFKTEEIISENTYKAMENELLNISDFAKKVEQETA